MKKTNLVLNTKICGTLALFLMAGCKERQEVTEALRKDACETIAINDRSNSKELFAGCKKGVENSEKIAASRYQNNSLVDPDVVMLGALGLCYSEFGPSLSQSSAGKADQLMGCNIGVMEALAYSKNVLQMLQVEKMRLADENAESGSSQPVFSIAIPVASIAQCSSSWTDALEATQWNSGCIGFSDLTPQQLYTIAQENELAQKNFVNNGNQAALRKGEIDQQISKIRLDIQANFQIQSQWNTKAAPMEKALSNTLRNNARTDQELARISQLLSDEQSLPGRTRSAWADRDAAVAQAAALTLLYSGLSFDLRQAESDFDSSRREFQSARSTLDSAQSRRDSRLRREREERERKEAAARAERDRQQRIEDDRRAAQRRRDDERHAAERRAEDSRRVNSSSGSSSFGSRSGSNSSSSSSSFGKRR